MKGPCWLQNALEELTLAGYEQSRFGFLGSGGTDHIHLATIQLRGRELTVSQLPKALLPAAACLLLTIHTALLIHRPGWADGTGAMGQAKLTIEQEIRIVGMDLGGAREAFFYCCRPEDLVPRGEGLNCHAMLDLIMVPQHESVRAG